MTKLKAGKLYAFFPKTSLLEKQIFSDVEGTVQFINCAGGDAINVFEYVKRNKVSPDKIRGLFAKLNIDSQLLSDSQFGEQVIYAFVSTVMNAETTILGASGMDYNSISMAVKVSSDVVKSNPDKKVVLVFPPLIGSTRYFESDYDLYEIGDNEIADWNNWFDAKENLKKAE